MCGQSSVGEYAEHCEVLGQGCGGEGADMPLPRDRDEVLEQQCRDPVAMKSVSYRERDLGSRGIVVHLICGDSDDLRATTCQQRDMAGLGCPADPLRLPVSVSRAQAEEPEVHVVF